MKRLKLFYGSSYDRSLEILLYLWPDIIKEFPEATLDVCYGWSGFLARFSNNPERMKWKNTMDQLLSQSGITHHGRVGKDELKEIRSECGIWAYPSFFLEINCITALESQRDGLVPVVTDLAALKETVGSGFKIKGDIRDTKTLDNYKKALFRVMQDPDLWKKESKKAKKFAKDYYWNKIAGEWGEVFSRENEKIKVTVFTPTIRDGFFNITADTLSKQTHQNLEWIIVDDHEDDRSEIAKKYAKKYDLDVRYFKSDPKVKRDYSLVAANNLAIDEADGELFVFLQDFIQIPETALERLVDIYRHNKDAFIAPVDRYYKSKIEPSGDVEDWYDGETDIMGEFLRANIRDKGIGLRESFTVTDFEQNFGAVGTKVLRDLGGYYEFFDAGLCYDDTEIIYRAFEAQKGYRLLVDDSVCAKCLDHWPLVSEIEKESGPNRMRRLNDPRYYWMIRAIEDGELPVVRDPEVDDKIDLEYEIPEDLPDSEVEAWMRENLDSIVDSWR